MRIRGVFVLLVTLVFVMGIMAFFSLSLTGNVIEDSVETTEVPVIETETPQVSEQESLPSLDPLLSPISGFVLRATLTGIVLNWDAPLDASKIIVWRSSALDGSWFIHEVISSEQGGYTDEDISVFNQYHYRIQSFDGKLLSPISDELFAIVMYDGSSIVVSEDDKLLFENPEEYVDESFSESEYLRRLALYNQKTYCEVLSLKKTGIESNLQLDTLADCNTLARVVGDNSDVRELLQPNILLFGTDDGLGGKDFAVGGGVSGDTGEGNEDGNSQDNVDDGDNFGANSGGESSNNGGNNGNEISEDGSQRGSTQAGDPCDATFRRIY